MELFTVRFRVGLGVLPYTATIDDGNYNDSLTINSDGTYEFNDVPAGNYTLTVQDNNSGFFSTSVNVSA